MNRVLDAATSVDADVIVEITGDCPLIDPDIVEQSIRMYKAHSVDYVSNVMIRSYPDGMDSQVMSVDALRRSASLTNEKLDLEHVSLHIRNNPKIFSRVHLVAPPNLHWPELGLTLDEPEDFELISAIIKHIEKSDMVFSCSNMINFLKKNMYLLELNKSVIRKGNT